MSVEMSCVCVSVSTSANDQRIILEIISSYAKDFLPFLPDCLDEQNYKQLPLMFPGRAVNLLDRLQPQMIEFYMYCIQKTWWRSFFLLSVLVAEWEESPAVLGRKPDTRGVEAVVMVH